MADTSPDRAQPDGLASHKLLVVDDNEDNRYTLRRRLKRLGFTDVEEAEDGRQALDRIAAESFDLVFLDIMMPELDGYQVLEQLRDQELLGDLPVIVISALDDLDSVARCIELGAEDYLSKPFNPTLLRARVYGTLEKKRLRDEVSRQLAFIQDMFGKYVPAAVAAELISGSGDLQPRKTIATVLYCDLEGFTGLAENMTPERVVQMLNEYFPAVIEPITRYGGVVNQFQGDAMLVTFNVPLAVEHHADNAVRAALGMQEVLKGSQFAGVPLRSRIGINTGELVAGNVGSGDRINYTVHGDAVNMAARLEQLNKDYGTSVLVSGDTVATLEDSYPLALIGEVSLRGKAASVQVYKLES